MVVVDSVIKSFGSLRVLNGVSFSLEKGSITGLIGPSGGGKSVLLKVIGGVDAPDSGTIDLGLAENEAVSLMFQEGALFDSLTVFDNVAFSLVHGNVPASGLPSVVRDEVYEKVSEVLARVGLTKAAFKMPGQISGGMRRRASLARALVNRPQILLLDDPTSGLDPVASGVIMELIVELHKEFQPTTLMVSHDLRRLFPSVKSVLGLFHGKITYHGALESLRSDLTDESVREEIERFVACRYDLFGPKENHPHHR